MAKAPKAPEIDEGKTYRIDLARSIKVGRMPVHPGPNVKLRGDVLRAVIASDPDAVKSYEPAEEVGN